MRGIDDNTQGEEYRLLEKRDYYLSRRDGESQVGLLL